MFLQHSPPGASASVKKERFSSTVAAAEKHRVEHEAPLKSDVRMSGLSRQNI